MTAPKRPAHRPPLPPGAAASVAVNIRIRPDQRAKLAALGGAAWVRDMIDRAKPNRAT